MSVERNQESAAMFACCIDEVLTSDKYDFNEKAKIFVKVLDDFLAKCPIEGKDSSEVKHFKENVIADFAIQWFQRVSEQISETPFMEKYLKTTEVVNLLFAVCVIENNVNLTRIFNRIIQETKHLYKWSFGSFLNVSTVHECYKNSDTQYGQVDSVISKNFIMFLNNAQEYDLTLLLYSVDAGVRQKFWRDKLTSYIKDGDFSEITNPYHTLEEIVINVCPELAVEVFNGILNTTLCLGGSYYPLKKILKEMKAYSKCYCVEINIREKMPNIIFFTLASGNGEDLNEIMKLLIEDFGCDVEEEDSPTATKYLKSLCYKFAPVMYSYFGKEKVHSLMKNEVFRNVIKSQEEYLKLLDM